MRSQRNPGEREIERIYSLLDEPPVDFDCGSLCRLDGKGPLCCVTDEAVPSVYHWEWRYLSQRTGMWRPWRSRDEREWTRFMECKAKCDVYVECEGAARCDRRYRSFVCRVFPLEPYVENDWSMSGVIFNTDFDGVCPLTERPHDMRPEFVGACIRAWQWLMDVEPEMHEIYRSWSQVLRRRSGQLHRPVRGFDMRGTWRILRPATGDGPARRGRRRRPR
jgi:hypothetical protein